MVMSIANNLCLNVSLNEFPCELLFKFLYCVKWLTRTEDCIARNQNCSSYICQFFVIFQSNPTINFNFEMDAQFCLHIFKLFYLSVGVFNEGLSPKSGVYAHKTNQIQITCNIF